MNGELIITLATGVIVPLTARGGSAFPDERLLTNSAKLAAAAQVS